MTNKPGLPESKGRRVDFVRPTVALAALLAGMTAGCLDRPVSPATPNVTNVFVDQIVQNQVDKIDLLFMIDNSLSMADKQQFLQAAVPGLLQRLVQPNCVDENGATTAPVGTGCAEGSQLEFTPINDIHIGVVTSSLGARGKPCSPGAAVTPMEDDKGHLVGSLDRGKNVATYGSLGFLAWDPTDAQTGAKPQSTSGTTIRTPGDLTSTFTSMIVAVGEQGCGYESGLEGWYRFLIDPDPPASIDLVGQETVASGIDQTVLDQRKAFLRPDSLVAIIMLADENDCSIIDFGQGWLTASESRLPRGTSKCADNPNDKCCFSCRQAPDQVPSGCPGPVNASSVDKDCQIDAGEGYGAGVLAQVDDAANLRCWQTKRRFGFDLLFSTDRYVEGLTKAQICGRETKNGACVFKDNPLMSPSDEYPDLSSRTDSGLIYLAGIIGVPWQDIATEDTLDANTQALTLMDFNQITAGDRWSVILGDLNSSPPKDPSDPFMRESVDPRSGSNPITGQEIVDSGSNNPTATINGHEVNTAEPSYKDDLQYACTFELPQTRDCTLPEYTTNDPLTKKGCDCKTGSEGRNRPLCNPPGGGDAGTQQYFAKGYPGLRYLQVLKDFGTASVSQSSIVASVCPKFPKGTATDPQYGYNPAVNAIINRLKEKLKGACLPRQIVMNENGTIACQVVEVTQFGKANTPSCDSPGRAALPEGLEPAILKNLQDSGKCGASPKPACKVGDGGVNLCALKQAEEADYQACLMEEVTGNVTGFCYIDALQDANQNGNFACLSSDGQNAGDESGQINAADPPSGGDCIGNPDLVKDCAPSMKRLLRFVSPEDARVPAKNSTVILACKGQNLPQ